MLGQKGFATLIVIQALSKLSYGFRNNSGSLEKLAANRRAVVANTHTLKRLSDMIDSVPVHGERQMARAIVAIMAPVLFIMFTEAGRAADLTESYTFKQSDGSEYTTTFVIKEKGSGLGSTVTGSVNWGHKQNNQDSPDGKLENADWVVEKAERKDLGESEPATQIVWTIIGKRKDDPQAEGTIVINCPTKLGEDKHINRVIIYGGSLGAGKLPIFSIEESEQTAALKALEELGMIDKQPQYSPEVDDLKGKIWEAELAQRNFAAGFTHGRGFAVF